MQRTTAQSKVHQVPQRANGSTGPTPIDPRDFKFVSGGSPKGGWPTDATGTTTQTSTQL